MYSVAATTLYFNKPLQCVCSAIVTIGNEKPEYTILEEVSPCNLQLSVAYTSRAFNTKCWYYIKVNISTISNEHVVAEILVEEPHGTHSGAAQFLDKQSILKEFVFIVKNSLAQV